MYSTILTNLAGRKQLKQLLLVVMRVVVWGSLLEQRVERDREVVDRWQRRPGAGVRGCHMELVMRPERCDSLPPTYNLYIQSTCIKLEAD